jgi:hypothetical protein
MATLGVPVFSIEANPRYYGFACTRLWGRPNVTLLQGDSREMLNSIFDDALLDRLDSTLFIYLDAHWNEDLPPPKSFASS